MAATCTCRGMGTCRVCTESRLAVHGPWCVCRHTMAAHVDGEDVIGQCRPIYCECTTYRPADPSGPASGQVDAEQQEAAGAPPGGHPE